MAYVKRISQGAESSQENILRNYVAYRKQASSRETGARNKPRNYMAYFDQAPSKKIRYYTHDGVGQRIC
jgi:hypothetical protein